MTISNQGSEPDALVVATTDIAAAAELHETIEKDGKMVMQPRPQLTVPAGGTLAMKPGSYHLMLFGVKQALQPGDAVHVTLTFEKAGQVSVEAPVKYPVVGIDRRLDGRAGRCALDARAYRSAVVGLRAIEL